MSAEEKVGRAVLFPIKIALLVICLPLVIVSYPVVGVIVFVKAEGSIKERVVTGITWPLFILAFNEFVSIAGMDTPFLTRLTEWLNRPRKRHKELEP